MAIEFASLKTTKNSKCFSSNSGEEINQVTQSMSICHNLKFCELVEMRSSLLQKCALMYNLSKWEIRYLTAINQS